jgi:ubiquinone/menaquinone biosynthesis C-methylase UbiE
MNEKLQQISQQQRESWNKFSSGWKKWDAFAMDFLGSMGDEIVAFIQPKPAEHILDIASGTGEPALNIASMIGSGTILLTDVSEDMLAIARENAELRGITNIEALVCDVSELPFADNTFDAVSCRFGFMFFPDMLMAAKEIIRVLKPGGRFATSVWDAADKNQWVTIMMGTIAKNMTLPTPVPGAPGMFRCAEKEFMVQLFKEAGFKNVSESKIRGKLKSGTAEKYWNYMTDCAAPVVAALDRADATVAAKIRQEVFQSLEQQFASGIALDSAAIVIYGEK